MGLSRQGHMKKNVEFGRNLQVSPYCDRMHVELICRLYSTQRPPSGCRSSGTDRHLLLPKESFLQTNLQAELRLHTGLGGYRNAASQPIVCP